MKEIILFLASFIFVLSTNAQIVSIPDSNFKIALINHIPLIDTNSDGEIELSEATAFTGTLNVKVCNISDLTGIEFFKNITGLDCSYNYLTTLDVNNNTYLESMICSDNQISALGLSNNTVLVNLECDFNQLTVLDLSNNTAITYLDCQWNYISVLNTGNNTAVDSLICSYNQLDTLDISNFANLRYLVCDNNQFTTIDLDNNTLLETLWCSSNQISSLNLSNNALLKSLVCDNNQISVLDLSHNLQLTELWCNSNQMATLDVSSNTELISLCCTHNQISELDVSSCILLESLVCSNNLITSLDLSINAFLTELYCRYNSLIRLNIKNGNNVNIIGTYFNTLDNPGLYCIEVDDSAWSANNWLYIDMQSYYRTDCNSGIPREPEYCQLPIYPNPAFESAYVECFFENEVRLIQIYDIQGSVIELDIVYKDLNKLYLDLSEVNSGVYVVNVFTDFELYSTRLIKQ